ncbi:MAG: hypothetical protein CSA11_07455 [Chloroflexi bacterium]|nr:MAG: hypothetical protein CSA11_07455 [Chloroflexota bacterium]
MNNNLTSSLNVYEAQTSHLVARISLNGYDIHAGGLFPTSGAMRSFVLLEGDLWEQWDVGAPLMLTDEQGQQIAVRVAALPVEEDSYGLIEFL